MADETSALNEIAAMLRQLMDQRKQLAALREEVAGLRKAHFLATRDGTDKVLEDSPKYRTEAEERMRKNAELTAQRHEELMRLLRDLLAEFARHNSVMERHNELIARFLEREGHE